MPLIILHKICFAGPSEAVEGKTPSVRDRVNCKHSMTRKIINICVLCWAFTVITMNEYSQWGQQLHGESNKAPEWGLVHMGRGGVIMLSLDMIVIFLVKDV